MTTITSTELGAAGRYLNLGSVAALDDTIKTIICYCRPTAYSAGGAAYIADKLPTGTPTGMRFYIVDSSGTAILAYGADSSTSAQPLRQGSTATPPVFNSWQHLVATDARGVLSSGLRTLINGTDTGGQGDDGTGSRVSDAAHDLFLMNRGNSGALGREFVGDIAYWAFYTTVLDSTQLANATTNGPLSESSSLICVVANDTVYSGPQDASNTITITARSTRVTGALPPNTALGTLPPPPVFAGTPSAQTGTVGTAFSWAGSALSTFYSGGTTPYVYALQSGTWPAGLSINSSTGVVSGTPTAAGSASIVVRVTDAVSGVVNSTAIGFTIAAAAATALDVTGPSGGTSGSPSATITIVANGTLAASKTVTASDGAGGSFTFAGGTTLTNGGSVTCTYTAGSAGAKTLTFNVSDASLTADTLAYTASAPSSATEGVRLTLYNGAVPRASLTGLTVCWWDSVTPHTWGAPTYQTNTETTDAAGELVVDLSAVTALAVGGLGFLLVYQVNATVNNSLVFAGQVSISDVA